MLSKIKNLWINIIIVICLIFFLILSVWWISIYSRGLHEGYENNSFTLIYPFMSLIGGVVGIFISKNWGSVKSYFGRSIFFFSLGLFAQFFGQAAYAYYIYVKGIGVPYPSIGDIGYFGSVIFYIIAVYLLARVSGLKFSFKSLKGKFIAFIIPLVMLIFSYLLFLQEYEFDWSNKLKIFLDFGYPFGQVIYVSIAILSLIMCRNILGGMMKKPVLFLVFVLIFQYFCDFTFLYQASKETWYVGGVNDYMYFISYFLMTISLIHLGSVFQKIRNT